MGAERNEDKLVERLWLAESRDDIRRALSGLAEAPGMDVTVCELCEEPLDDSQLWRRGLDGAGAHEVCLRPYLAVNDDQKGNDDG